MSTSAAIPAGSVASAAERSRFPLHVAVFLAPALVIYTAFSIYPLVDTIRLSLYAGDESGVRSFVRTREFPPAAGRSPMVEPVLERAAQQRRVLPDPHGGAERIGLGLAMLLSASPSCRPQRLPDAPVSADDAVRRHHRLRLAADAQPLWGIAETIMSAVGLGRYFALPRAGGIGPHHHLAHFGLAVRRHPDDAHLRGASEHPGRSRGRRRPSTERVRSASSGSSSCRSSCRRWASSRSSRSWRTSTPSTSSTR